MNDTQILTLVITLLGIFAASWFNNSRIGDISKRIDDMRDVLRAEMKADRAEIKGEITQIMHRIERMDDNIARVLADHDRRLTKLEEKS